MKIKICGITTIEEMKDGKRVKSKDKINNAIGQILLAKKKGKKR